MKKSILRMFTKQMYHKEVQMKKRKHYLFWIGAAIIVLALLPFARGLTDEQRSHLVLTEVEGQLSQPLRGVEYYEYFLVYRNYASFKGAVYNNIRTQPIPLADWNASDPKQLAKEMNATKVIKNGPRFWTLDHIKGYQIGERRTFNGYDLDLMAVLDLSLMDLFNRQNYTDRFVERYTDFYFNAGSKMFVLTNPQGVEYFMQSASLEVDPHQDLASLETLGDRLKLPEGWTYTVVDIQDDFVIQTRGEGHVIQDDLHNTYQRKP